MCVCPLVSRQGHRAPSPASVCITGAATAPAQTFLSSAGLSQGVHQHHVPGRLPPFHGGLFCERDHHFARLETSAIFLIFPPPCPKPPSSVMGPCHSSVHSLSCLCSSPFFSRHLLIPGTPCSRPSCIPGKRSLWKRDSLREMMSMRVHVKKKISFRA